MKYSIRGIVVILAIAMSLVAVQGVYAEWVKGTIVSVDSEMNEITVDDIEIKGIKYNYLCNHFNVCLALGMDVGVTYYEYECPVNGIMNKACDITIFDGDKEIAFFVLRDCE